MTDTGPPDRSRPRAADAGAAGRAAGPGAHPRGRRRATGCRTRRPPCRPRSRPSSSTGSPTPGCAPIEATSFVHPKWVPQLADAEQLLPLLDDAGRRRAARCWCPTSAASTGRWRWACARSRSSAAPPRSFAQAQPQPHASTSRWRCSRRWSPGPGTAGVTVRGYLSMCFGDPWEGAGADRPGGRAWPGGCSTWAATELSLGDTIGVATPGQVGALLDRARRRRACRLERARRALPRHLRPGAGQHPGRAAARRHHRRRLGRRPRRLPVRQERHRQSRHRGPGVDAATASASTPGSTSAASPPPASGWPTSWAAPARPAPSAPSTQPRSE